MFELPAGWLSFAAGFEHRKESGYSLAGRLHRQRPDTRQLRAPRPTASTRWKKRTSKLAIPLLKDLPGAQLLDFMLPTRYSDYSNFGDTLNSKFGFKWKPIDECWSVVTGPKASAPRRSPICTVATPTRSPPTPIPARATVASPATLACRPTAPPAASRLASSAEYNSGGGVNGGQTIYPFTLGGNPDLTPETSTSKTLGVVYSPTWATGLNISLDWWSIELENRISSFAANTILDKCYVDNISSYCDLITRDATGLVTGMFIGPINAGFQELEGYDLSVKYRLADTSVGTFGFSPRFHLRHQEPLARFDAGRLGSAERQVLRVRSVLAPAWQPDHRLDLR